jgi:hypothetical protein
MAIGSLSDPSLGKGIGVALLAPMDPQAGATAPAFFHGAVRLGWVLLGFW